MYCDESEPMYTTLGGALNRARCASMRDRNSVTCTLRIVLVPAVNVLSVNG